MDPFSSSLLPPNGRGQPAVACNWSFCTSQYSLILFFPATLDYREWPNYKEKVAFNDMSELLLASPTQHVANPLATYVQQFFPFP